MYKRILVLVLSAFMLTSSVCIAEEAVTASAFEASEYGREIKFLNDWGIIQNTGSPDEKSPTMTRAEFAVLVDRAMGYNGMHSKSQSVFGDVGSGHYAFNSIMTVYESKLMCGTGEGMFNPDDDISLIDAVAVCVKMLNFDKEAVYRGGYPNGYRDVAAKAGLYKNIRGIRTEARRDDIYVLLYNTVHADMALFELNGEDFVVIKDRNILTENHKIYQIEGIVEADNDTALTGKKTEEEGSIVVDGILIRSTLSSTVDVIGRNVHCYYKEDDDEEYTAVAAYPEDNRIINVTPSEVDDFDYENGVYTLNSDGREKKVKIGSKYHLVYNDEKIDGSDRSLMLPTEGRLTFVDNNEDDIYDVLFVEEYYNLILGTYDAMKNVLYDKLSNDSVCSGRFTRNINLNDYERVICNRDLEKVSPDTVICVYKTLSKEKITLEISGDFVSGKLMNIVTDKDIIIDIADRKYRFSNDSRTNANTLRVGEDIVAYLDTLGKVAYVSSNTVRNSGYLLRVGYDDGEQRAFFRILTPAGISSYMSADRIRIMTETGTTMVYPENVSAALPVGERGFVLYELNADKEIKRIIIPQNVNTYNELNSCSGYPVYKMNYYITNWPAGSATKTYRKEIKGYDNWLIFDDKAVVYTVPPENDDYSEDGINVSLITSFPNKSKATLWSNVNAVRQENNIDVYRIGDDSALPNVMVSYEKEFISEITEDQAPAVIAKIQHIYDEEDEEACYVIDVAEGGKIIKLKLSDDELITDENGKMLSKGDIIKYSLNKDGKVNKVEVHYRSDNRKVIVDENANYNTIDRIYRLASGKVLKKNGNYLEIELSYNGATKIERYNFNSLPAVVYNTDENEVNLGTTDLISVGDDVVFYSRYMNNRLAVVYKN